MSIKGLENWQILQQINGYADCNITYEVSGWLKNPIIPEEKRVAALLKRIRVRVIDETTGEEVIPWIEGTDIQDGKSYCTIKNIPVGGLYIMQSKAVFQNPDGSTFVYLCDSVRHWGVGDVYLIAGQSNAEGSAVGLYDEEAMLGVNVYMQGIWDMAVQPLGGPGISPFLAFAKHLKRKLGYPIGLIPRAVGGSPISTWVKGGAYTEKLRREVENGLGGIKAVLWYQGCSDTDTWEQTNIYESQFLNFWQEMKDMFGAVPIVTFQLNRLRSDAFEKEVRWNKIRETQRQIALRNDNCYIIPTIDLIHMSDHIHNGCSDSRELGLRAAKFVLDKIYAKEKHYEAPVIENATKTDDNEITISFDNVVDGLICMGSGYPITVSENGVQKKIKELTLDKNTVRLKCDDLLGNNITISINSGIDPTNLVYDNGSKLPVICVYEYCV